MRGVDERSAVASSKGSYLYSGSGAASDALRDLADPSHELLVALGDMGSLLE